LGFRIDFKNSPRKKHTKISGPVDKNENQKNSNWNFDLCFNLNIGLVDDFDSDFGTRIFRHLFGGINHKPTAPNEL